MTVKKRHSTFFFLLNCFFSAASKTTYFSLPTRRPSRFRGRMEKEHQTSLKYLFCSHSFMCGGFSAIMLMIIWGTNTIKKKNNFPYILKILILVLFSGCLTGVWLAISQSPLHSSQFFPVLTWSVRNSASYFGQGEVLLQTSFGPSALAPLMRIEKQSETVTYLILFHERHLFWVNCRDP